MEGRNILFIGCGNMGKVLLEQLVNRGGRDRFIIVERSNNDHILDSRVSYFKSLSDISGCSVFDLVFLCVKPQSSAQVLQDFLSRGLCVHDTIYVSILAGKKVEFFENILGKSAKIVRSMPNMAIKSGYGIFPYLSNSAILESDLEILQIYFSSFGISFKIGEEDSFDILTAIFGCGPAYIFLLQEVLTKIAVKHSLDKDLAIKLVKNLLLGGAKMSDQANQDFAELKSSVASKGGVTQSALEVLEPKLHDLFDKAIDAAIKKGKDLSE